MTWPQGSRFEVIEVRFTTEVGVPHQFWAVRNRPVLCQGLRIVMNIRHFSGRYSENVGRLE
ncbi:hypothetical protein [Streptomyces niveus]|uniref:hypothetical protein n=1 Tax=Streptomyces niveus TaxID=193462 RepID=UPI0003C59032|nr:hypothetical protein [Streptomyces niveus]EST32803.1 hypothetical protein M877_03220 [Streptomyces niveus NCIMB 11891]